MKGVPFDGTYQIFFFCEAVRSFCEQVMLVKERAEREREREKLPMDKLQSRHLVPRA